MCNYNQFIKNKSLQIKFVFKYLYSPDNNEFKQKTSNRIEITKHKTIAYYLYDAYENN